MVRRGATLLLCTPPTVGHCTDSNPPGCAAVCAGIKVNGSRFGVDLQTDLVVPPVLEHRHRVPSTRRCLSPLLVLAALHPLTVAAAGSGEANSRPASANRYFCQMKAMITDWRARWQDSGNFTFGLVQLAAAGDSSGGVLRWSQAGAARTLQNVAMAVAVDLYDAQRSVAPPLCSGRMMTRRLAAVFWSGAARLTLSLSQPLRCRAHPQQNGGGPAAVGGYHQPCLRGCSRRFNPGLLLRRR